MKFSIRDLLLVTVIVAVCVAWWLDHRRQAAELERLKPMQFDLTFPVYRTLSNSSAPAANPHKE
jgi:hypothetical protein